MQTENVLEELQKSFQKIFANQLSKMDPETLSGLQAIAMTSWNALAVLDDDGIGEEDHTYVKSEALAALGAEAKAKMIFAQLTTPTEADATTLKQTQEVCDSVRDILVRNGVLVPAA